MLLVFATGDSQNTPCLMGILHTSTHHTPGTRRPIQNRHSTQATCSCRIGGQMHIQFMLIGLSRKDILLSKWPQRGTFGPSPPPSGRGPIECPRANVHPRRRPHCKAHACFPMRGGPCPRAPPRAWDPRRPRRKQGCGSHLN